MALKESNKNRKKIDMITDEVVESLKEDERLFGIDAPFTQQIDPKHVKWIGLAVLVAIVALLVI